MIEDPDYDANEDLEARPMTADELAVWRASLLAVASLDLTVSPAEVRSDD